MSLKARVFISCGQRKETEESLIAKEIADKLEEMGFEPYVAVVEQSLKGVKENIFNRLKESEYFVFIDFKRERLYETNGFLRAFKDTHMHRGSLFSHQELGIATFLDYDVLAFQEDGVKKDDGILGFIQANCLPFSERRYLPSIVADKVREKRWDSNWRNELILRRTASDFEDANNQVRGEGVGRYFHIKVFNAHKDKMARNCVAYIEKIKNLTTMETRMLELVELKWKGVRNIGVSIAPKQSRYLDAFHINITNQSLAHIGINPFVVDWQGYFNDYQISGSGDYEIDYVVFSEDFSPTRATFKLHIGSQINDVVFVLKSPI